MFFAALETAFPAGGSDTQPTTPDGWLSRRAGNYLAANELINEFSRSKCAGFAPKQLRTFDDLAAELLPALSPRGREEMREALPGLKRQTALQAKAMVTTIIESVMKDEKMNVCAKSLAVVSKVFGESSGAWAATRQQFGTRR